MTNDNLDNEYSSDSYYPEKPNFEESESRNKISVISILWFIGLSYWFFDRDWIFVLYLVVVIMLHEMGHYIAMRAYNYQNVKMFFVPMLGAMVSGLKEQASQKQKAIVSLAGPVPGILIAIGLYFWAHYSKDDKFVQLANIFISINLFNLLPLQPLDGGHIIENLFFDSKENIQKIFGIISAGILVILSIYMQAYLLLVVPFFMVLRLRSEEEIKSVRKALDQEKVNYRKPFDLLNRKEYSLIRASIIYKVKAFQSFDVRYYGEPAIERPLAEHMKMILKPAPLSRMTTVEKIIFSLIWLGSIVGGIYTLAWYFSTHVVEL